ncbi:MAG: hypothetical protein ACYC18_12950 [Gammaproteobacteria bacterium]
MVGDDPDLRNRQRRGVRVTVAVLLLIAFGAYALFVWQHVR